MKFENFRELIFLGWKEAMCCIFPVIIFLTLAVSKLFPVQLIYRYDFILIVCILAQLMLVWSKMESIDELKVITLFHVIGFGLELYKVNMGSWSYPEEGWTKIGGVPLYSGFMYASVASYVCQAWKRFDLHFINWPRTSVSTIVAILIYLNFFTHHFMYDIRWIIVLGLFIIFFKTKVLFTITKKRYEMPILLSFFLIAIFIWIAENISTFFGAWKYPNQQNYWQIVHWGKISSWFLLVIISIIIVAELKQIKYTHRNEEPYTKYF
ncbi:Uncharacterized membrane protein YoaT, DUF817 family [Paenibacillus sp. yr247]|uniref:DUF817 domain-containing protein n=1 Tax=Paenibacillus sp. yr247 TaxID=1761880 RepID=UPI0008857FD9|nr:DUF817 domain-containing protein [Paenibacillus sp. yr247]SDN81258.1 Uncharacterized membrane protein YoaT, DUF817 family [Paenibacillus sp. yr247]